MAKRKRKDSDETVVKKKSKTSPRKLASKAITPSGILNSSKKHKDKRRVSFNLAFNRSKIISDEEVEEDNNAESEDCDGLNMIEAPLMEISQEKSKKKKKKKKKKAKRDENLGDGTERQGSSTSNIRAESEAVVNDAIEQEGVVNRTIKQEIEDPSDGEESDAFMQVSDIMQDTLSIPFSLEDDDADNTEVKDDTEEASEEPSTSYYDRASARDSQGRLAKRMSQFPEPVFNFEGLECCEYTKSFDYEESHTGEVLHQLDKLKKLTKEEIETLKEEDVHVCTKRWSRAETHRLQVNFKGFVEAHKDLFDFDPDLLLNASKYQQKDIVRFRNEHHMLKHLAFGLDRELSACFEKAKRVCIHAFTNAEKRFSGAESRQLKELLVECGGNYREIAQKMGRSYYQIVDKITYDEGHSVKGGWSRQEDAKLIEAINSIQRETGLDPDDSKKRFPWNRVKTMVPGRNKMQVRRRWRMQLGNTQYTALEYASLKLALTERLEQLVANEKEPIDDRQIDWPTIATDIGCPNTESAHNIYRLLKMRVCSFGQFDLSVQGVVERLNRVKSPWLKKVAEHVENQKS